MKDTTTVSEIVVGVNPVLEELRRSPTRCRRVLVARGARGGAKRVFEQAASAGVPVVVEDPKRLRRLSGGHVHQGVIAEVESYAYADWYDLLGQRPACVVALDQITDPRNLGAIVRSADAFGVGGVVIPEHRSAGVTAAAVKAAAGATASVPVVRVTNLVRALEELKRAGYWAAGLDAEARESVFSFRFPELSVIVVGSEGKGLRPSVRAACDATVAIRMVGSLSSLNVSVAAAVAFYERLRQRQIVDTPSGR